MPSATEFATQAWVVSRILWVFAPYILLALVAMFLWKGREANTARASLVIFSWSLVLGMFIATLWLVLNMPAQHDGRISYAGALLTGPLLRRVVLITGALAVHALLYMIWAILTLERTRRNVVATWLAIPAVMLALCSLAPQVRFWRRVYNPESMRSTLAWHREVARETESFTTDWAVQEPQAWQALLLRANMLYDANRVDEAQAIDRQLIALPENRVPDDLRGVVVRRLDSRR
jgi:hypothetical protein